MASRLMRTGFAAISGGVALLTLGLANPARASIVVYDFSNTTTASTFAGPSATDPNVTSSNTITGPNLTQDFSITDYGQQIIRPATIAAPPTNDEAGALSSGSYFSFTVTPNAGEAMNISSLTFDSARGGAATPRSWYWFSSIKGFTAGNEIAFHTEDSQRPTFTHYTSATVPGLDVSAIAAYQHVNVPVEFRMYVSTPAGGQSIDADNITINGTVTAAASPEPASMALIVLAGLGVLGRRSSRA